MIQIQGLWYPDDTGDKWKHAQMHLTAVEWALAHCRAHRTAVQAGGNLGLWPRRIAAFFDHVITFEPDARSRACLERNVPENVTVYPAALGDAAGRCAIKHRGLGSHRVVEGDSVAVTTIDALQLTDVDYLQLDVEGYEWHALSGAVETIARCKPLVQVELRNFTEKYGRTDAEVRALLSGLGYTQVSRQNGSDTVFQVAA